MTTSPSLGALNVEIRVLMVRKGKRQEDLSESLGIKQSQVARRLSGEIEWKYTELLRLADALDVDLRDLITSALPAPALATA